MQTVKYFNLVGDKEDMGNEQFKWSRASTFRYNGNAIGLSIVYASAIRTGTVHHMSVHGPDDCASTPLSSGRGNYLPTQSQALYHSASSNPSARRSFSGFDGVNEEAVVCANATVIDRHANVRASAVMANNNDNGANVSDLDDILSEILGASSRVATPLDLDRSRFWHCQRHQQPLMHFTTLSTLPLPTSHGLSSFFCCCWGAHLKSGSFHWVSQFPVIAIGGGVL